MAAWAGSADLSPVDKTAYPRAALGIGIVMLVAWLVLLTRVARAPMPPRQRRLDLSQMSASERRWTLALALFGIGLIGWLNAAATVDWAPLVAAVRSGKPGPAALALALVAFLVAMLAGVWISWARARTAFRRRLAAS